MPPFAEAQCPKRFRICALKDLKLLPPSPPSKLFTVTEHDEMNFNTTPNQLTLLRIALVPAVVGLLTLHTPMMDLAATIVFIIASITDAIDGYLARKRQQVTIYGKLLDPLADKFLVVCTLIMLLQLGRISYAVVMLLVCREFAITGLRALASAEGVIIEASGGGKWKTAFQMIAIPMLMLSPLFGWDLFFEWVRNVGLALLYLSLALSLWSAKDYAVDFFRALALQRKQRKAERKLKRAARRARRQDRERASLGERTPTEPTERP